MSLIGLTLEVQGGSRSAEGQSLLMLEIRFASPGLRIWLKDYLNGGAQVISDIGWIEDKLYLSLHPKNADYELLRTNWLAEHAEFFVKQVATAFDWELPSQKNGE